MWVSKQVRGEPITIKNFVIDTINIITTLWNHLMEFTWVHSLIRQNLGGLEYKAPLIIHAALFWSP